MLEKGLVLRSTGSWYDIRMEDGTIYQARLRGKLRLKELKVTNPVAVGDYVQLEIEDEKSKTAIISAIDKRQNYIVRQSVHRHHYGHILAANIDYLVLIATLGYPNTSTGFIDRFLVSAEAFRIPAILVFNKADLLTEKEKEKQKKISQMYEKIGYPCYLVSALTDESLDEFESLLQNKKSLIAGHSGVGKSTLINRIAPEVKQTTREVSKHYRKGVHTTTFAEMFEIKENTFIIDTPGIKELELMDIEKSEIGHYFPEIRERIGQCKFHNCSHLHEPKCAIKEAMEEGNISPSRYRNYLSMLIGDDSRR